MEISHFPSIAVPVDGKAVWGEDSGEKKNSKRGCFFSMSFGRGQILAGGRSAWRTHQTGDFRHPV
jgi:hypothetical protein